MRVGVTQRVEIVSVSGERRDCLDQAWTNLLNDIDCDILPVPNNLININEWAKNQKIESLILTGGNDLSHLENSCNPAPERDRTEKKLLQWATKYKIPVLGVCRGMQKLNYHLQGTLSIIENHVATEHTIIPLDDMSLFKNYHPVNSYHNWGIYPKDLSPSFRELAVTEDGVIEAISHLILPWVGIMWHPERDNGLNYKNDIELIRRVLFLREGLK